MHKENKREDSLQKRYFFKLSTKIISIPIIFITEAIVPRALGVVAYGNFSYLTDFFNSLISIFDSGTSTAFYTKLSQRPEDSTLIKFYWRLVTVITTILLLLVVMIFMLNKSDRIWIGQESLFIWLAFFWGILSWANQIVYKIVDAYGLTVKGEIAVIKQKAIALTLLAILFVIGKLNIIIFFFYHFTIFLIMIYLWKRILNKNGIQLYTSKKISKNAIKNYGLEFYRFSVPLLVGGILSFPLNFADRWLLQLFGGSGEQGLYSLSNKVSTLCFLFTSSMVPLFQRDISKAFGIDRHGEMRRLFLRYVPMLYSIATCIGIYFFSQADKISLLLGGKDFKGAALPISLMALYPLHQTLGQLNSSVYFASGQTKLYRNIGLLIGFFGLLATFFFLAPHNKMGLNLGSTGLALKMVIVQIVGQNILLWYNTKLLNISFMAMLWHQFISVLIIGGAAWIATSLTDLVIGNIIYSIIVSGFIYSVLLIIILYTFPFLFSTNRDEIKSKINLIYQRVKLSL